MRTSVFNCRYLSTLILPLLIINSYTSQAAGQEPKLPIFAMCDPYADQCGKNAVCGILLPDAELCERGICMCESPDFAPLYNNATDCGRLLKPGEACTTNNDAAMLIPEFAQCRNGVVTCVNDLVVSANGTCTVPSSIKAVPGEICDENIKCHTGIGLECVASSRLNERGLHCQCSANLIFKDGRCQRALYGDPCTRDDQCNVIYDEMPGAARSICRNGICVCGNNYIRVGAVVRTPPSSTLLRDINNPATILGYYCFSTLLTPRMTAVVNENCSIVVPNRPFDPRMIYCSSGLVCLHCAESGPLTRGKCTNMTAIFIEKGISLPPEPPGENVTPAPITPITPAPAKGKNGAGFSSNRPPALTALGIVVLSLSISLIIVKNNSAFYYSSTNKRP